MEAWTRTAADLLDYGLVTQSDAIALLSAAIVTACVTCLAVLRLATIKGTIPDWAVLVPLSWASTAGPARVVFSFGLSITSALVFVSAPSVSRMYAGTLPGVSEAVCEDWRRILLAVLMAATSGLFLLGIVTFSPDAARHLWTHSSLEFTMGPRDALHGLGAFLFFAGSFVFWRLTLYIAFQPTWPLGLSLVKLIAPLAAFLAAYCAFRRWCTRRLSDGDRADQGSAELSALRSRVCRTGAMQCALLSSILALLATVCLDLHTVAGRAERFDDLGPRRLHVQLVIVPAVLLFGAALAVSFWTLPRASLEGMSDVYVHL